VCEAERQGLSQEEQKASGRAAAQKAVAEWEKAMFTE